MNRHHLAIATIALAALVGCEGSQASTAPSPQQNASAGRDAIRAKSWMLSAAKSEDLLYVSNVYTITVYSYPKGKLVGTLDNFDKPYGECVDKNGNVYVTDSTFDKIYEYAHGGAKPIHTLKDPGYVPYGCAVDPATGNLAVANYSDASAREGNLVVYRKARGSPKSYTGYSFYYYYYCGYDAKGNLYVDGFDSYDENVEFGELPKGADQIKDIVLPKTLSGPGGIQWDGQHLAVGDSANAVIYQFTFSGSKAALEGTTPLTGAGDPVGQFAIAGSTVVAPNQFATGSNVLFFPYPAGGAATKTITDGVFYPFSAAISLASTP